MKTLILTSLVLISLVLGAELMHPVFNFHGSGFDTQVTNTSGVVSDEVKKNDENNNKKDYVEPVLTSPIQQSFEIKEELQEAGQMKDTRSPYWWLNSGGIFYSEDGVGKTVQGELPEDNPWRILYNKNNPRDTDNGYHPQNIFRLVTRSTWKNFQQYSYFRITQDNLSTSSYRNASNGLLLFNRYQDGDNLYYTGVRVDGFAVIKKKIKGQYFTMAYERVFPGKYDRKKKPNLLPLHQWIGLRSEVSDTENGSVNIKVFMDRNRDGNWKLVAEATDNGKNFGGKVIAEAGHAGIRTDFMDVEFDDYRIEEMK